MTLRSGLIGLLVSGLVAYFLFQSIAQVPESIQQRDDVFKIYFSRKLIRALSILGEWVGYDHHVNTTRRLTTASIFSTQEPVDYTDIKVENSVFDGVPVRIYVPQKRVDRSPGLVWIHGGGWVNGRPEADEAKIVFLAKNLNIVVISIRYRLAPEHIYPAALDDCFQATLYFLQNAASFQVDSKRVAIGGSSAGGNLAAAVSLKMRDQSLDVRPSIQFLIVPCLQAVDFMTPSYQLNADDAYLPTHRMVQYWLWYSQGPAAHHNIHRYQDNSHVTEQAWTSGLSNLVNHDLVNRKLFPVDYRSNRPKKFNATLWSEVKTVFLDPYFAPLMATNLTGLPETLVVTAQWDVLRDDGTIYARRLAQEGNVDVEHFHYERGFHDLLLQQNRFELSKNVIKDIIDFLSKRL